MFVLAQSVELSNYLLANVGGLVLGCIEADFAVQILVGIGIWFKKEIEKKKKALDEMTTSAPLRPPTFSKFASRILSGVGSVKIRRRTCM